MITKIFQVKAVLAVLVLFIIQSVSAQDTMDPLGMMLTWQRDPTTTMTIDWYTQDAAAPVVVNYRARGASEWLQTRGDTRAFPFTDRHIHRVELTGLQPDTEYEFRIEGFNRIRLLRTMPDDVVERAVKFVAGGDIRHDVRWQEQTSRQAMKFEPDFVMWGGDLAYADGREDRAYRWFELLNATMHTLVTPTGRSVPVLASNGNHEVRGGYYRSNDHELRRDFPAYTQADGSRAQIAPYYFALFAFPGQPGYGVMDFGNYLSVILLDSDHTNPIGGQQADWLRSTLAARTNVPHVFPIYHVGGFPSVRNPNGTTHRNVREHWVPLFEQFNVRVVFENHDHVFKRTFPIRNGQISRDGVVYIGDGAWGTDTRELGRDHTEHAWYLERAASQRHAIVGVLQGSHQQFLVVNELGEIIDEYPRISLPDSGGNIAERWIERKD
jgi:hypothetical protein